MRATLILCALVLGGCTVVNPPPPGQPPSSWRSPPPSAIITPRPPSPGVHPGSPGEAPPSSDVPGSRPGDRDTCGADGLRHLIGQRVPRRFDVPGPVRIVARGEPMTMDHNPQRLTVTVTRGPLRRILSLECG